MVDVRGDVLRPPHGTTLATYGEICQAYFICTPNPSHFQVTFKFLESFITHLMCAF